MVLTLRVRVGEGEVESEIGSEIKDEGESEDEGYVDQR